MLSENAIQAELKHLYKSRDYWEQQFQKNMRKQNYHSIATVNCTIINSAIRTLEMVIGRRSHIGPVFEDNGNPYSLMSDSTLEEVTTL
jgi:hypothetical protein